MIKKSSVPSASPSGIKKADYRDAKLKFSFSLFDGSGYPTDISADMIAAYRKTKAIPPIR